MDTVIIAQESAERKSGGQELYLLRWRLRLGWRLHYTDRTTACGNQDRLQQRQVDRVKGRLFKIQQQKRPQ